MCQARQWVNISLDRRVVDQFGCYNTPPSLSLATKCSALIGCTSGRKSCCVKADNLDTGRIWAIWDEFSGRDTYCLIFVSRKFLSGAPTEYLVLLSRPPRICFSPQTRCRFLLVIVIQTDRRQTLLCGDTNHNPSANEVSIESVGKHNRLLLMVVGDNS